MFVQKAELDEDGAQWEIEDEDEVDVEDLEYVSDSDEEGPAVQGVARDRGAPSGGGSVGRRSDRMRVEEDGQDEEEGGGADEGATGGDIEQLALTKKIPLSHQVCNYF
jgi:hypothetical protein